MSTRRLSLCRRRARPRGRRDSRCGSGSAPSSSPLPAPPALAGRFNSSSISPSSSRAGASGPGEIGGLVGRVLHARRVAAAAARLRRSRCSANAIQPSAALCWMATCCAQYSSFFADQRRRGARRASARPLSRRRRRRSRRADCAREVGDRVDERERRRLAASAPPHPSTARARARSAPGSRPPRSRPTCPYCSAVFTVATICCELTHHLVRGARPAPSAGTRRPGSRTRAALRRRSSPCAPPRPTRGSSRSNPASSRLA